MPPVIFRDANVRRQARLIRATHTRDDGTLRRILLPALPGVEQRVPRLQPVRAVVMHREVVVQRTNHGQLVGDARMPRHQFADLQSGQIRVDRLKRPAHFRRGVRFHVDHVDVRRPPREPKQNHGRFGTHPRRLGSPQSQQVRQR